MLPTTVEIRRAIQECSDKCERSDKPFTTLADFCVTLSVMRGWHESVVWLVERRVLKLLR